MDYRIEKKYLCDMRDYHILRSRVSQIMQLDHNSSSDGYLIRSIYFDDIYNSCYFENEDGVDNRKKYRIRSYNTSSENIKLECKSKLMGYTNKKITQLSKNDYYQLIDDYDLFNFKDDMLLNELKILKTTTLLKKSLIIEYCREAYTCEQGNVRVTFDKNIEVSTEFDNFFEQDIHGIPMLRTGQFILEIKYDEYLPKAIAEALELNNLQQMTFSKFYYGKKILTTMEGGFLNEF